MRRSRIVLAVGLHVVTFAVAGPVIASGGYGGLCLLVFVSLVVPGMVALIVGQRALFHGLISAGMIVASMSSYMFYRSSRYGEGFDGDPKIYALVCLIVVAASLPGILAAHSEQRRQFLRQRHRPSGFEVIVTPPPTQSPDVDKSPSARPPRL